MRRMLFVLLAALVGVAGCTSRKEKEPAAGPAPATRSPSPASSPSAQPPGKTCAQITATLSELLGVTWRLRSDSAVDDRDVAKPGVRQCDAQASSTDHSPPALLTVALFRPRPNLDSPDYLRRSAENRAKPCTTELTAPPAGVLYAVSCLEPTDTLTRATTTLLGTAGWVSVSVAGQHKTTTEATNQAKSFVDNASRQGAATALACI